MKNLLSPLFILSLAMVLNVTQASWVQARMNSKHLPAAPYRFGMSLVTRTSNIPGKFPQPPTLYRYVHITAVEPGSPAADAGLRRGQGINAIRYRGQVTQVNSTRGFDRAIAAHPKADRIDLRVLDPRTGRMKWKTLQIVGLGNPAGPGGGPALPPASPKLDGIWISSGGGTIHFRGNNPITAESNVPFFGRSDLRITPNGDGTYNFTYQQRGGLRDSGYGKLTPRNGNTIDAYLVNAMGIKVDFVLTR